MKMKIILLLILMSSIALLECRNKKKQYVRRTPVYSRPAVVARPGAVVGGRPAVFSNWYRPAYASYFRWNWLYGIGYPRSYILENKIGCNDACAEVVSDCENVVTKVSQDGFVSCQCGEEQIEVVKDYCWTPRGCFRKSSVGCGVVYRSFARRLPRVVRLHKK